MRTSTSKAWPKEPTVSSNNVTNHKQEGIVQPLSVETVEPMQDIVLPKKNISNHASFAKTEQSNVLFTLEVTPERLWICLLLLTVLFLSYRVTTLSYKLEKMSLH
jgi:hypothetical protein